jgi:hypothetical protein
MKNIRHYASIVGAMFVSIVFLVVAPSAAFGMVGPIGGYIGDTPTTPHHLPVIAASVGVPTWQIALIAVVSALFAAALTAATLRVRGRTTLRPLAS